MKHPTKEGEDGSPKLPYYLQQTRKGKRKGGAGGGERRPEAAGIPSPTPTAVGRWKP